MFRSKRFTCNWEASVRIGLIVGLWSKDGLFQSTSPNFPDCRGSIRALDNASDMGVLPSQFDEAEAHVIVHSKRSLAHDPSQYLEGSTILTLLRQAAGRIKLGAYRLHRFETQFYSHAFPVRCAPLYVLSRGCWRTSCKDNGTTEPFVFGFQLTLQLPIVGISLRISGSIG